MRIVLSLLLCCIITSLAFSQQIVLPPKTNGAEIQRIGNNVYAIIHDDATDQWPHGNTGVIVGDAAVMVIDACYLPSMAREDIRLIRLITKKPVKYLAFTHWHFDHNNGTVAYTDSFPGITIISERESQKFIELNGEWWSKMCSAPGSVKKTSLVDMEAAVAKGKDTSGKVFTAKELEDMRSVISKRKNELNELASLKVVAPNKVFDRSLTIDLGNKKVQLIDRHRANSPHDVTFYLPKEQILFTGDILVQSPLPYLGESWPVTWVKVLSDLEKVPVKAMMMGHGPVQHDHSYTRQVREFLETVTNKVEAMIREGKTLDQIKATINVDELKKGVWANESNEDWQYNLRNVSERIWKCVRGQGGLSEIKRIGFEFSLAVNH